MQLYALNAEEALVFAPDAHKQHDYFCLECRQIVRRRGGEHRQIHYYHLSPSLSCRLSGKSMTHLQVQSRVLDLLPPGEGQLEYRFPSISRIADVVWLPQKFIFEIQCSPITAEEVRSRNQDYGSLGFHVIWILHDNRYNQKRLTAAEKYLEVHPCYFTNITPEGVGIIYDQYTSVSKGMRNKTLEAIPVDLGKPSWLPHHADSWTLPVGLDFPQAIVHRARFWKFRFHGDLLSQSLSLPINGHFGDYITQALKEEKVGEKSDNITPPSIFSKIGRFFHVWIVRPYSLLFQIILEKACK